MSPEPREEQATLVALAALGQPQRLRAFRALVAAGPAGMSAGGLAQHLGLAPSAMSFHLKELAAAALVSCEPRGRHLIYRADFACMRRVLAYLTEHCCRGCPPGCAEEQGGLP